MPIDIRHISRPDATQEMCLRFLEDTALAFENLFQVAFGGGVFTISPVPDLGIPNNVTRIIGGFLTGARYCWKVDEPFVPVDCTANVDGVYLAPLPFEIRSKDEFDKRIDACKAAQQRSSYVWNFDEGNHFIGVFCDQSTGEQFVLLHASAAEFKSQANGLYPSDSNWFSNHVERHVVNELGRELRYLRGTVAERFIRRSNTCRMSCLDRLAFFADVFAMSVTVPEVADIHYGLYGSSCVDVGVQQGFKDRSELRMLLTRPGDPVAVVRCRTGVPTSKILPHGLGQILLSDSGSTVKIQVWHDKLHIGDDVYGRGETLAGDSRIAIRELCDASCVSAGLFDESVTTFMGGNDCEVSRTLFPIAFEGRDGTRWLGDRPSSLLKSQ